MTTAWGPGNPVEAHLANVVDSPRHRASLASGESRSTSAWLLCSLLGLAWISLDATVWDYARLHHVVWPQSIAACGLGMVLGQAALTCLGLVGLQRYLVLRLLAAGAALYLLAKMAAALAGESGHADKWLALLGGCGVMLVFAFGCAALGGWRVRLSSVRHRAVRNRYQFSITGLFNVMTMTALCLGALHWLSLPAKPLVSLVLFCTLITFLSLSALSPLTVSRWRFLGVLLPLLASPAAALLMAKTGIPPARITALILMICVQTIAIACSVTIMSVAGLVAARSA